MARPREGVEIDPVRHAWDEHHRGLWRAVFAWSGDAEVASDAVAEAFAQAVRRGPAIHDVGAWVWRVAFRIAGGELDRRCLSAIDTVERVDGQVLPEDAVVVVDALQRLPERDRLVVVLALVGGWSASEIAEVTGGTAGAVRVRLHRARRRLQQELED